MLRNFKIPFFAGINDFNSMKNYMESLFSRWSPSDLIKFAVIDIGDHTAWDMDITDSITIPFGNDIKLDAIIATWVMIRSDDLLTKYDASLVGNDITAKTTSSGVVITRKAGGLFDSSEFNDTSISRGEVTICYLT